MEIRTPRDGTYVCGFGARLTRLLLVCVSPSDFASRQNSRSRFESFRISADRYRIKVNREETPGVSRSVPSLVNRRVRSELYADLEGSVPIARVQWYVQVQAICPKCCVLCVVC